MKTIAIDWAQDCPNGVIEVSDGRLESLRIARGTGAVDGAAFAFTAGPCRLEVAVGDERLSPAPHPTMVTVRAQAHPFTVLLRDVTAVSPVYLPMYGVAVLPAGDPRACADVAAAIAADRARLTALQRIESEPEENCADAFAAARVLHPPVWLGLSRDMRIFEVSYGYNAYYFSVKHRFHGVELPHPLNADAAYTDTFSFGRGIGCVQNLSRRLEDGVLPILHTTMVDDDVTYRVTDFVSLEKSPLTLETLRGTHFLVADGHGAGHMFTEEQAAEFERRKEEETHRDEETVLYHRAVAVNTGSVPRYAWFQVPNIDQWQPKKGTYDPEAGVGLFAPDRVYAVARLNGEPMPQAEAAVLLLPGESATFDFMLPHQPISRPRAAALAAQDLAARHAECRVFWQAKLAAAARLQVPETRIDEMMRAGLLHLDIVAYGLEPDGPVAATIGVYNPIGSESSPIIQFIDAMGWHDVARRAIEYFLVKQHDDGFIQNFGGYMLETGPALWTMGEHYRLTRDDAWISRFTPNILNACAFLMRWRERNLREDLRGKGYGLMEGKVADPEDPFRAFMLNGYACLGMIRAAEMLAGTSPADAARIAADTEAFKADIRTALDECFAKSPVVPLGDGAWCPTAPPWAEDRGPVALLTGGEKCWTHGTFLARDSMLGPLYLALQEVLDPCEPATDWLVNVACDLYHMRNVALSQPYYSPHSLTQLRRGEVKAFLKEFYNGFAGLSDRETYSFWEHYFHASPHKTHEEGWFLMQTRWMLWLENGDLLRLLPGIPRAWLDDGKAIRLERFATYFGPAALAVESQLAKGRITASVTCATDRKPRAVEIRLPHPLGVKAVAVAGGVYDPDRETVTIDGFTGEAAVTLHFPI